MNPPTLNNWTALEMAAEMSTRFTSGTPGAVADELSTLHQADALAVAVFLAAMLKPSQRFLLADLILGG